VWWPPCPNLPYSGGVAFDGCPPRGRYPVFAGVDSTGLSGRLFVRRGNGSVNRSSASCSKVGAESSLRRRGAVFASPPVFRTERPSNAALIEKPSRLPLQPGLAPGLFLVMGDLRVFLFSADLFLGSTPWAQVAVYPGLRAVLLVNPRGSDRVRRKVWVGRPNRGDLVAATTKTIGLHSDVGHRADGGD